MIYAWCWLEDPTRTRVVYLVGLIASGYLELLLSYTGTRMTVKENPNERN